jgi:hypothetical protein
MVLGAELAAGPDIGLNIGGMTTVSSCSLFSIEPSISVGIPFLKKGEWS